MFRWLCALAAGGVVTGFALLLLTGEYINDGPVLVRVTYNHSLHTGDLFVMAGWAVAMLALIGLLGASRRRHPDALQAAESEAHSVDCDCRSDVPNAPLEPQSRR